MEMIDITLLAPAAASPGGVPPDAFGKWAQLPTSGRAPSPRR
jgi:hypothetical protein